MTLASLFDAVIARNQRKGAKAEKPQRFEYPAPLDHGVFALRFEPSTNFHTARFAYLAALCLTVFAPQLAHAEGVGLRDGTLDLVFALFVFVWIAAPLLLFLLAIVSFRLSTKLQTHWSSRWSKINLLMTVGTLLAPAIGFVIHAGAKPTFFMGLLSACLALSIATTLMFQIVLLRRRHDEKMQE